MAKSKKEITKSASECCPTMDKGKECNILDFHYRLVNVTKVGNQSVPVEVLIHARIEKCAEGLELGKLVYSTTLFPGEKVKLFTADRRSRFLLTKKQTSVTEMNRPMNHNII